jgi:6-phosphogluconolactonase
VVDVTFAVEVYSSSYATSVADRIAQEIVAGGSLVVTGGGTAAQVYPELKADLTDVDVFFSDERCVPPDDANSNFRLAEEQLLRRSGAARVHRMHGEDSPLRAARDYHAEIAPVVERGFDLMILGMGSDGHIAALFPNSAALIDPDALCLPVDRPDGLKGLSLTAPALVAGRRILLIVTGEAKAEAVARAVNGNEDELSCPVRLLAGHPDATFLLDQAAASAL